MQHYDVVCDMLALCVLLEHRTRCEYYDDVVCGLMTFVEYVPLWYFL